MRSTFATILALSLRLDSRERSLSKYHTIYKHIHHASNIHDRIKDRIHHIIILYTIYILSIVQFIKLLELANAMVHSTNDVGN